MDGGAEVRESEVRIVAMGRYSITLPITPEET